MNADRACIVLPTYDEHDNLPKIVPQILAAAPEVDVLVVDDASPDGTGEIADDLARASGRVKVLHRPHKDELGPAYLAGFARALAAGYGRILEMDADSRTSPRRCRCPSPPPATPPSSSEAATSGAAQPCIGGSAGES